MYFILYLISSLFYINYGITRLIETVPVSTYAAIEKELPKGWPKDGLLVFPESGRKKWIDALSSAKKSIEIAAYKLSDPIIIHTLLKIKHANPSIRVTVSIQPYVFAHDKSNNEESPIELLKKNKINIHTLSERFNQAHYKIAIIDSEWGMVSSGNLDAESFDGDKSVSAEPCRDFAITITNPIILKEMQRVFQADTQDKRTVGKNSQLVWGPEDQRHVFLNMINSARRSIRIYQQDFQDIGIAQAVAGAARAGVRVEIIMMPFPFSRKEDKNIPNQELIKKAGGSVYLHTKHYLHAKMLMIDDEDKDNQLMYIGSCNFYPSSLDQTRELGVLTSDPLQIAKVRAVFERDKKF